MSKIEQIEAQVKHLSPSELRSFREWFLQFEAELWDRQIEADADSGKLLSVAENALRDHEAGRSTLL